MHAPSALQTPDTPTAQNAAFQERIHGLWDSLAAFDASRVDDAMQHLLTTVAGLVDAQSAYWTGAVRITSNKRDPLLGWRPRAGGYLSLSLNGKTARLERQKSPWSPCGIHELSEAHVKLTGSYRVCLGARDMVSPDSLGSDTHTGYVGLGGGSHGLLVVGVPVSETAEIYYSFLRMRTSGPFSEEQRDIALYAIRPLAWFHRRALIVEGLVEARSPLSPMERQVVRLLLTEHSEKIIAAMLAVTPATLHTYVRDVLRKFDVSGRNGLNALLLGGAA